MAAGASLVSVACADLLGIGTLPTPADASAPDADAAVADELPTFDAASCDACAAVPAGWAPVLVSTSGASCPAGTTASTTLETSPTFEAGACTCNAESLVAPTCTNGNATFFVGCSSSVSVFIVDGGCTSFPSTTLANSEQVAPIAPSGGSCSATPQADPSKLGASAVTTCTSDCPALACAGQAPAGFSGCIEQLGADASCPAPFVNRQVLAGSYTLGCACGGCTASATCAQPTLTLYDSCAGKGLVLALDADDVCHSNLMIAGATVSGATYASFVTNVGYTPDPATPSAIPQNERTVCCR
jgi:hypothetical protein